MNQPVSLRTFARYAAPGILGQVGISCYILADTFFVSRGTGAIGLAALNIALPLYNLMNGIGLMIGVGSATHFTICRAQHQQRDADRTFTHAVGLGLAAGVFFLLLGLLAGGPLARLLGADADTFPLTLVYLRTLLCFGPFFVMNNVLLAFVRNDGGPNRAMAGMIIGSLSNVVMDYVFIFPLGMGMFGAALATGVSPIISILILSGHLRAPSRGFHLLRARPRLRLLPALCTPGLPSLISELSSGVVLLLFNQVLLRLAGNTGVAAYGIVANLALVAVAIFTGLSTGTQPLVSHSSGTGAAAALRRLLRYGVLTALAIATVLFALVFAFAGPIAAAFNSAGDPVLADYAVTGLRIYFLGFWCAGLNIVSAAFFSASGRAAQGFAISLLRGVIVIPPVLLALTALAGVHGVWATFPTVEAIVAVLTLVCIWRAFRRTDTGRA
nr:MATE family efflux transporter [uncultured Agathobaculum sp.]